MLRLAIRNTTMPPVIETFDAVLGFFPIFLCILNSRGQHQHCCTLRWSDNTVYCKPLRLKFCRVRSKHKTMGQIRTAA